MRLILGYIRKYKITYISIIVIFILGIILGGIVLSNISSDQTNEIRNYIIESVESSKEQGIDKLNVFKKSIVSNMKFIFILYLLGCTIIASLTIYVAIIYKGFILGYTGSAILITYGIKEGAKYLLLVLILHNIIYLPIVFLLATSGIRMYKEIMKKSSDLKIELLRHSIIMLLCVGVCIVSSGIESYFSTIVFEIL